MDEPTNYLDRDGLGALTKAIEDFNGGVIIISHNKEFANAVSQEKWIMEKGLLRKEGESITTKEDIAGGEIIADDIVKDSIDWLKELNEAEYQGRDVKLGKPMQGDVKKFKVYVKNPKGNVVKVNFGQKGMNIKKDNPGARKSFRARHNCDNPGPRHKARYWSCKKW